MAQKWEILKNIPSGMLVRVKGFPSVSGATAGQIKGVEFFKDNPYLIGVSFVGERGKTLLLLDQETEVRVVGIPIDLKSRL